MRIIYFTCSGEDEAKRISKTLIEQKLAACTNIFPIRSMYMWEGNLEEIEECSVLVKTSEERHESAIKMIRKMHSYKVPSISSWKAKETESYASWIEEVTS
jgi:periplasmic divalent cation tolerance protein